MSKIIMCGDPHISGVAPRSRVDDYPNIVLGKLEYVRQLAISSGIDKILMLGDMFHTRDQRVSYMTQVFSVFKQFQDSGIEVYSLVGNHDIACNRMDTLDTAPISLLFKSGLVRHLKHLRLDSPYRVTFTGFDYPEELRPVAQHQATLSVCVAHRFLDYDFDEYTLRERDLVSLGYNIYILGHDHVPYPTTRVGDSYVIRPGALTRGSSHKYNLVRSVAVSVCEFLGTEEAPNFTVTAHEVPCVSAEQVFSGSVFLDAGSESGDVSTQVESLLESLDTSGGMVSVYTLLDQLELSVEVRECLTRALRNRGFVPA